MASRNALPKDFKQVMYYMEQGLVDIRPWISHRIACSELEKKLEQILQPHENLVKAMVEF